MAAVMQLFVLVFLSNFLTALSHKGLNAKQVYVTLDTETQTFKFSEQLERKYVVFAKFMDALNATGWSYLDITASPDAAYNDSVRAYAAGLAESYLTWENIDMNWQNTRAGYCEKPYSAYCKRLQDFLTTNLKWVKEQIKNSRNSSYWHHVALFYEQLAGLQDGYNNKVRQINMDIDIFGMYAFQFDGDLEDLEMALHKPTPKRILGSGSCSALVKLSAAHQELFVAQDTWSSYQNMLRILKRYKLGFAVSQSQNDPAPGDHMTFSSYPGSIMSGDDYYHLSSGMISMETTIGNSNNDLWKYVKPTNSVLEGIRSLVANRLATSGNQWAEIFSDFNSGTYNNMWMIVDMKKFVPNSPSMEPGLLTVLEQIPGKIKYADLSSLLEKQKYFASYNVAYFPEIFNASGGPENVAKYGDWFSYDHTARANIFRRDQGKVVDMESFLKLMRYNDYTHDPLSRCNCTPPYSAENAISARSDLNPKDGKYPFQSLGHRSHGGLDAKITSYTDFINEMTFVTVAGPTYDQQPPFQWSKADFEKECPHFGQPDLFKFTPMIYNGTVPADFWKPSIFN